MMRGLIPVSRRAFFAGMFGTLVFNRKLTAAPAPHDHPQDGSSESLQGSEDTAAARLGKPWLAGQPRKRVTAGDNDPFVIAIENRVKCNCGCAHSLYACRTTDFSCGFWQPLHAQVIEMADSGMSAEEIIDAYVGEHGTQYLMAPPPEGFNLAGYFVPSVVITAAAATLAFVLRRRTTLAPVNAEPTIAGALSEQEQARLRAELEKLGT